MTYDEALTEAIDELVAQYQHSGWVPVTSIDIDSGVSIENLHTVSEQLEEMVATNPLMARGAQLRYGYVFGRGINWKNERNARPKMRDRYNRDSLFSPKAWEELNKARFTAGNVFVLRNKKTNVLTRVPIRQITGAITDPESAERIWAIERQWTVNGKQVTKWYALNTYKGPNRITDNANRTHVLDRDHVMYHHAVNRQVGWTFGVPDGLAALTWAVAYSEYIKNNATLVRAYARFAFQVTSATPKGQQSAAAQIAGPNRVGGTGVAGPGTQLTAMPATGSTVDFSKGSAIASLVAASLGISVIALLTDPSTAAGSYGSAQTLDQPTILGMQAIQESWVTFFEDIVQDMGAPNVEASFPNITSDAPHREAQMITAGVAAGLLHREEGRAKYLPLVDVEEPKKGLPKMDEFTDTKTMPSQGNEGKDGMIKGTKTRDD